MKQTAVLFVLTLLALSLANCRPAVPLFQPESNDWVEEGNAQWTNTKGVWQNNCTDCEGFLMTKTKYDNFELRLEFFPDQTINSGVFVRCSQVALSATECHEMNIWDLHPNQDFRTGAIVTKALPKTNLSTINRWNTYTIRCQGNQVKVWINKQLTATYDDQELTSGYIGLQAFGKGSIRFRNIRLKEL